MRIPLVLAFVSAAIVVAAVVSACSSGGDDATKPAPQEPVAAAPAANAGVPPGTGRVLEALEGGGYTYVRVDLAGAECWAAGPKTEVKAGDVVTLPEGMAMHDFESKSLGRTFPIVWFVPSISNGAAPKVDLAKAAAEGHARAAAGGGAAVAPVERLAGGQTVEEIVSKRAELSGKDVAVRARVVKFNAGILGSNWIHVQDGTGAAGTNDLTVTTDATVAIGDVVVVRGKVTTDKDFGAGYKYAVIVEKAAVEKQ